MSDTAGPIAAAQASDNPLLKAWQTPFETPPFAEIRPEHFLPAFEQAFADHSAEIAAITNDPAAPDFANTITALERSGKLLSRVSSVFYDLVLGAFQPGAAGDRQGSVAAPGAALESDHDERGAVRPHRAAAREPRHAGPRPPSSCACWSAPIPASTAPAPGSTRRRRRGWPRSTSGWRISAPPSATICSATSRTGSWSSARATATACRRASSPPPRPRPTSAACPARPS